MIYLIIFILSTVGLTDFIATAKILKPFREWVTVKNQSLGYLLSCFQCIGIYASFFIYLLLDYEIVIIPMIFIGSFLSKLYNKLT